MELRKVPFQFFNEDGLERIAGLVGHPKFLHPTTANKTNLEVAKVFTIIDPRKPLPEAVNVQFDSGEISRVLVSSPWMPPVCGFCKEIGHCTKRCPTAPKSCATCKSSEHEAARCPQKQQQHTQGRKTRRGKSKEKQKWVEIAATVSVEAQTQLPPEASKSQSQVQIIQHSKLGTDKDKVMGESSNTPSFLQSVTPSRKGRSISSHSSHSEVESDSSDVESSDSELEEGELSKLEQDFTLVKNKKCFSGLKGNRGRGPKFN